ncbi:MAG: hypothetical protein FWF59_13250 [Turicibacter sp.]|nr:hypothetical protein [Turicibacter sp.]
MHTVMMLNNEALDLYRDHSFLFHPFKKDLDICPINEGKDRFDEIFPGLQDMIYGKGPWRAFVFVADDVKDIPAKADTLNPFDFSKGVQTSIMEESKESLIRLTHHLGGFPAKNTYEFEKYYYYLNRQGEEVRVDEQDLMIRHEALGHGALIQSKYEQTQLDAIEQASHLIDKYDELVNKPTEIYLIKLRMPHRHLSHSGKLQPATTPEKDDFSAANHYPPNCRFLAYDLDRITKYNQSSQFFQFWLSVLTLAHNEFTSSIFKANELYNFKCQWNKEKLGSLFSQKLSQNEALIWQITETLNRPKVSADIYGDELIEEEKVAVGYKRMDEAKAKIDTKQYSYAKEVPALDTATLESQVSGSLKILRRQLMEPRRKVADTAKDTRMRFRQFLGTRFELDGFQKEDVKTKLSKLQEQVFSEMHIHYLYDDGFTEELAQTKNEVREDFRYRLFSTTVWGLIGTILATVILAFLIIFLNGDNPQETLLEAAITLAVTGLAMVGVIFLHRRMARQRVDDYNLHVKEVYQNIAHETKAVEDRMEDIFNYMRYHHILTGKDETIGESQQLDFNLKHYLARLKQFNARLETLGKELQLPIKNHPVYELCMDFDPQVPVEESPLFYLNSNKITEVAMPNQEFSLKLPYEGIEGMDIQKLNDLRLGGQ